MCWAMPRNTPAGAGLPQPPLSATAFSTARCFGWFAISLRRNSSGSILAAVRQLVHEALQIDRILVVVDAAPEARRDMRVAHRVVDQQVRDGVAELAFRSLRIEALELHGIAAVLQRVRVDAGQDRLAGDAHVQRDEVAVGVEAAHQPALRGRMIDAVRHVLFARPDRLDRHARHLLGDQHRVAHEIMAGRAPAESAAEVMAIDLVLVGRKA